MRCGVLHKIGKASEAGGAQGHTLRATLGRLWEHVSEARAALETGARQTWPRGARRRRPRRRSTVIDGPFIEAKELLGG